MLPARVVCFVLLIGLIGLAPRSGAAQRSDEETYESPNYDYTLTYDPDEWEVTEEDDDEDDPYDRIQLSNGSSLIALFGDPDYDQDELPDCLDDYLAGLEESDGAEDIEPLDERGADGEDDDRAWATYSYTFTSEDGDEFDWIRYYECRWLGDGVTLVIIHTAAPEDYDDEAEAREDLLAGLEYEGSGEEPEDDPIEEPEEDPTEEATEEPEEPADEEAYESPTYGYTVAYDPGIWEIAQEDEDEDDAYDSVALSNGVSLIYFIGTPDYDEDELDTCIADFIDRLETASDTDEVEQVDGRGNEGSEADRSWTTYSYTYVDGGDEVEWTRYYECRWLGDGVTLVIVHDAPPADYEDEVASREDLLDGLEAP